MTRILLYTTPFCGYCRAAKQLLHDKALDFEEIDVAFDDDKRAEMIDRAMGLRTVPQIFIHGRHVGGYDELAMLEREGKLDAWLAAAPPKRSRTPRRHDAPHRTDASAPRLVQLRSGRSMAANLDRAEALDQARGPRRRRLCADAGEHRLMELKPELVLRAAQTEDEERCRSRGSERSPPSSAFFSISARLPSSSTRRASPTAPI